MIQFMPAIHSNTNSVITILIHSDKTLFQNVFVTLLRHIAKDVTSSLLSWHKHLVYDFNAANFPTPSNKYMYSNTFKQIHVLQHLQTNTCTPTPSNEYMYSNTFKQIHVLQHLQTNTCTPTPSNKYMYSNTFKQIHVLQHLQTNTCTPTPSSPSDLLTLKSTWFFSGHEQHT